MAVALMSVASCGSGASRAPGPVSPITHIAPTPDVSVSQLRLVSCSVDGLCMAVGSATTLTGQTVPVAVAETAGVWQLTDLSSLVSLAGVALTQVSCFGGGCMVTGRRTSLSAPYVSALWNGRSWATATLPEPDTGLLAADGLSCSSADRCLEVGENGPNGFFSELWQGAKWVELSAIPVGSTFGIDMSDCTMGGSCMVVASPTPSYAILNGSTWSPVASLQAEPPSSVQGLAAFQGLSCLGTSFCVAVGALTSALQAVSVEWNGTSWQSLPVGPTVSLFSQVSCARKTFCMATGQDATANPTFSTWNGTTWSSIPLPPGLDPADVSCSHGSQCVTVGLNDLNRPVASQWNGNTWTALKIPSDTSPATS
jgi:hypothetical protein